MFQKNGRSASDAIGGSGDKTKLTFVHCIVFLQLRPNRFKPLVISLLTKSRLYSFFKTLVNITWTKLKQRSAGLQVFLPNITIL